MAKGYHTDPPKLSLLIIKYVLKERERCAKIAHETIEWGETWYAHQAARDIEKRILEGK